jgi:hypothetical protein
VRSVCNRRNKYFYRINTFDQESLHCVRKETEDLTLQVVSRKATKSMLTYMQLGQNKFWSFFDTSDCIRKRRKPMV